MLCQGALWLWLQVTCPALCHFVAVTLGAVTLGLQGVQISQTAADPGDFEAELLERHGAPQVGPTEVNKGDQGTGGSL